VVLVFLAVFLLSCTERPVEQGTDSGTSGECGYGPSYATVDVGVADQEMRLSKWDAPECAPALLDFFACGNKADDCDEYWVLHSLVENIDGECRSKKDEVCRWDCGCVGTDHDS
jgi:hypothetical protein